MQINVKALAEALQATGTGKKKLEALLQVDGNCKDKEEFLQRVGKILPVVTVNKIKELLSK
jgi:hypothetical protein